MSNQKIYTNIGIRGNNILYRGYENGKRVHEKVAFSPTLFVPTNKKTIYKTLFGQHLEPFKPGSINDCRDFLDRYSDVDNFDIYGNTDYKYQFIAEEFCHELEYDIDKFNVAYIDIETKCEEGFPDANVANEEIIVITVRMGSTIYTFGINDFGAVSNNHECYVFRSESDLFESFLEFWEQKDIDIVTGWNINFFDIPYLINRINKILGDGEAKRLSPWNHIKERIVTVMQRDYTVYDLVGISTLDYFDLYRKLTFVNRESYKLDHIAYVELGERKTSYTEYDSLRDFYTKNFPKFVEYNVRDVDLVVKLEEKLKLMELALRIAYSAKVNHNDIFSQVKTWDQIIYHHLNSQNIIIPLKKEQEEKEDKFIGAYVKEPDVGMHKWIASFDLDSLYPHLIMQYNLSPETITSDGVRNSFSVDDVLNETNKFKTSMKRYSSKDLSVAANATTYRKDKQGFLPKLMETLYEERKMFKNKMLEAKAKLAKLPDTATVEERSKLKKEIAKNHNFQLARKIQLNSAFGAIGNQYFRYFNLDIAEAITLSGQLSIRWIETCLNDYMNNAVGTKNENYVIASDTDSIYLRMDTLVNKVLPNDTDEKKVKFLLNVCDKALQPFIEEKYQGLATKMNVYAQKMHMKREAIANKGIWTAKKRYMLNVMVGESGVILKTPEQKIMGIETARSSTPEIVRDALGDCINIILNGTEDEMREYIANFEKKFNESSIEDVSFPRGCNGMEKYADSTLIYKKSTPIAVKGALLYNNFIRKNKLQKKYSLIKDGEKIKFVYLKQPNTIGGSVVSFVGRVPDEFDLRRFVDFDKQFEISFKEPLCNILNVIGWKFKKENTLESLFA